MRGIIGPGSKSLLLIAILLTLLFTQSRSHSLQPQNKFFLSRWPHFPHWHGPFDPSIHQCWSTINSVPGCHSQLLFSFFTRIMTLKPSCCKALDDLKHRHCLPKMLTSGPFRPFFPPLVEAHCSDLKKKEPLVSGHGPQVVGSNPKENPPKHGESNSSLHFGHGPLEIPLRPEPWPVLSPPAARYSAGPPSPRSPTLSPENGLQTATRGPEKGPAVSPSAARDSVGSPSPPASPDNGPQTVTQDPEQVAAGDSAGPPNSHMSANNGPQAAARGPEQGPTASSPLAGESAGPRGPEQGSIASPAMARKSGSPPPISDRRGSASIAS